MLRMVPASLPVGFPIRKSAHQQVFALTRGLSQLITSFVASESQGILYVPLSPFLFIFAFLIINSYLYSFSFFRSELSILSVENISRLALLMRDLSRLKSALLFLMIRFTRSFISCRFCHFSGDSFASIQTRFQYVNVLSFVVVLGRVELPTSTLSV